MGKRCTRFGVKQFQFKVIRQQATFCEKWCAIIFSKSIKAVYNLTRKFIRSEQKSVWHINFQVKLWEIKQSLQGIFSRCTIINRCQLSRRNVRKTSPISPNEKKKKLLEVFKGFFLSFLFFTFFLYLQKVSFLYVHLCILSI